MVSSVERLSDIQCPYMALGVRPDASLTRLNVASDWPNDERRHMEVPAGLVS
jgi:hypothetical protein